MNLILLAIPFFILLIAVEIVVDWRRQTGFYRVNDAITSLGLGIVSRITGIAKRFIPFTMYFLLVDHIALIELPNTWWVWVLAFVLYDFCYYWLHRMSHEVNILWAAHVVHHSSEEYNLTTALRQTSGGFIGWIFYIPLALLGIPAEMFIAVGALNLIYQFWVHTRHIPKLGWYEEIFVTPSNHRVHHAQNQIYIDRNYGGVFIIWDRLFGSFQEELEHDLPVYGISTGLNSWNPLWANLHVYWQLCKDAWHTRRWQDKLGIWFRPTGWRPDDMQQQFPLAKIELATFQKFDIAMSLKQTVYSVIQHVLLIVITLLLMLNVAQLDTQQIVVGMTHGLFASISLSMVMSQHRFAFVTEVIKHATFVPVLVLLAVPNIVVLLAGVATLVSVVLLLMVSREAGLSRVAMASESVRESK